MAYQHILYEKTDSVAKLTMNRPRYRNALSRVLLEELDDAFTTAAADDDIRVIILAGAGDHFSAGHDLGTPEEREGWKENLLRGVPEQFRWSSDLYLDLSLRLRDVPKPTIAQVQGYCIFGAWIIASAMDLIVAADDGLFLASHFQYFSVPWDLGARKAKEVLFQNKFLRAQEACELGLVNRVVPRAQLESETMALRKGDRTERSLRTAHGQVVGKPGTGCDGLPDGGDQRPCPIHVAGNRRTRAGRHRSGGRRSRPTERGAGAGEAAPQRRP